MPDTVITVHHRATTYTIRAIPEPGGYTTYLIAGRYGNAGEWITLGDDSAGADIMVEACIGADKRVVRHAHVPDEWSYGRLVERREGAAGRPAKNRECPICGAAAFLDCNLAQHPAAVPA